MEKEEQRRKMLEQREAARREMERQRQLEWQKQRLQELQHQKHKEQEKLALLRANHQRLQVELLSLDDKVTLYNFKEKWKNMLLVYWEIFINRLILFSYFISSCKYENEGFIQEISILFRFGFHYIWNCVSCMW